MDDELRKEIIRGELRRTLKGKRTIPARYRMKFPDSAEREYVRLTNEYMAVEKEVLMKYLPELKKVINSGTKDFNADSQSDNEKERKKNRIQMMAQTAYAINQLFEEIERALHNSFGLFRLHDNLNRIADSNRKLTVKEWKKVVSKTLGIDILEDYYSGDFYKDMLEKWVSDNVDLIQTVPKSSLSRMKELVYENYMKGSTTTDIVKEIQHQYGMDKRHARLIARDQTAKLNAAITKSQQTDAGIRRYEWSDSGDGRVRRSHHVLDGHIFSWDDPPETDGGRRCHPGEDYQCRCCALPVFDIDNLDIPV